MKPQIASSVAMMSVQSHWQIMADCLDTFGPYLITHPAVSHEFIYNAYSCLCCVIFIYVYIYINSL